MTETNNIKIIIIGFDDTLNYKVAKKICEIDDDLSIAPKFYSDPYYIEKTNQTLDYYIKYIDIYLAYKNNSLLYINIDEMNMLSGITFDDFFNNDISIINIKDFNMIASNSFKDIDTLIIWIDSPFSKNKNIYEINDLQYRLQSMKYLYFFNETEETITNTIIEYLNADSNKKEQILLNNS